MLECHLALVCDRFNFIFRAPSARSRPFSVIISIIIMSGTFIDLAGSSVKRISVPASAAGGVSSGPLGHRTHAPPISADSASLVRGDWSVLLFPVNPVLCPTSHRCSLARYLSAPLTRERASGSGLMSRVPRVLAPFVPIPVGIFSSVTLSLSFSQDRPHAFHKGVVVRILLRAPSTEGMGETFPSRDGPS